MQRSALLALTALTVFGANSTSAAVTPKSLAAPILQPNYSAVISSAAPTARFAPDALALSRFQAASARPFDATTDPRTGVVRSLFAGRTRPYGADPSAAALAFVRDAAPILGPAANPAAMAVVETRSNSLGSHVELQQTVQGVPVLGHRVALNLSPAGEVLTAENTTATLGNVDTNPTISALQAASRAGNHLITPPTLAIDANPIVPALVWLYTYRDGPGKTLRVMVDAHTGETLSVVNVAMTVTGSGTVYVGNPVSAPPTTQPFPYLAGDGTLTGTYTKVYKFTGSDVTGQPLGVQDAINPSNVFDYPTSDLRSGEAEAYWGISAIHDYFKNNFGFAGRDVQTPAYTQIQGYANADYNPGIGANGGMEFGVFNGYDLALDADVLFHEFTHAVIDKAAPTFAGLYDNETHAEQGGMNEGFADYFSCSYLNDPNLAEYIGPVFGGSVLRTLTNRYHFPEDVQMTQSISGGGTYQDFPEVHRIGEIWGPACWDLRRAIGTEKADHLIFDSLSLLGSTSRVQSALGNILTADQARYGGDNANIIRSVFNHRGITEAASPVSYLASNSFYAADTGFRTGYIHTDQDGIFRVYDPNYFDPFGLFPSMVVGRSYAIRGYLTNTSALSIFIGFQPDGSNTTFLSGGNLQSVIAATSPTQGAVYQVAANLYSFKAAVIPAGQTVASGSLSVFLYDQTADVVIANINTIVPLAVLGGYHAQVLLDQTPKFQIGDVDLSGAVDIQDATLVLRGMQGLQVLGADAKTRADVAPPYDGAPNVLDAIYILRTTAGLV